MNQIGISGPMGPIGEPGPLAAETDLDLLPHIIGEIEKVVKDGECIRMEDGCNHQRMVDGWALIQALDALKNYEMLLKHPLNELIPHTFYHVSRLKKAAEGVV